MQIKHTPLTDKFSSMKPHRTIYLINQAPALLKAWRELSELQKREVIRICEKTEDESEIEDIFEEVVYGRRRLF